MELPEITLPDTTPETEWVRARALRKVSPKRTHARVQLRLASALDAWAAGCGEVGTEWRFRIAPPGEARRPLVPDIAYVAYEMLRGRTAEELEAPAFAPTVAIEILSPGDRAVDVAAKIADYLACGCALVIVMDPDRRNATSYERDRAPSVSTESLEHETALPGFALALPRFYADALDLPPQG